jgi:ubiquitin carboxyl-terminal hydrolase 4/11/15
VQESQFELYPPTFTLQKYVGPPAKVTGPDKVQVAPQLLCSTSQKYVDFVKLVKRQLGIPLGTRIRVARVLDPEVIDNDDSAAPAADGADGGLPSPTGSGIQTNTSKLIDKEAYRLLEDNNRIDKLENKDESMNDKYNGNVNLNTLGLRVDQTLIIIEEPTTKGRNDAVKLSLKAALKKDSDSVVSSGRASPTGMVTRGRLRAKGRGKGVVGLTNLGNTCYMNSALQCMRACQELSVFFISRSASVRGANSATNDFCRRYVAERVE